MGDIRISQKKVYLDWSHLCEAFDEYQNNTPGGLLEFVNEVSNSHNICISFTHLIELLAGSVKEKVLRRAKWIDNLKPIWVKSAWGIPSPEIRNVLARMLDPNVLLYSPITSSFILIFNNVSPSSSADILKDPTVSAFVNATYEQNEIVLRHNKLKLASLLEAKAMKKDRDAASAVPKYKVLDILYRKLQASLIEEAKTIRSLYADLAAITDEKIEEMFSDIHAALNEMPFLAVSDSVQKNLSFDLRNEQIDSQNFEKHSSDYFDRTHLWGAAYCDIFTCDGKTSKYLNDYRIRIGFFKQVAKQDFGSREEMIAELWRQLRA